MSMDIQKGERYLNLDWTHFLISLDSSFRVKKFTGATLTSDDIEDDDVMPALIPIADDAECCRHCPFLQPRVKAKL
ncbi:hypothetical protein B0H16DRAFT_1723255 [Mycena metata]|uniref:Uncharacterized protein n=1 Tax=Mycena metata TaxID=1033252 RepID=A0AAD7NBV0_9AGAR|nr:hypothetical protein B0H16DRAFT_1723255 [Mycena metata]